MKTKSNSLIFSQNTTTFRKGIFIPRCVRQEVESQDFQDFLLFLQEQQEQLFINIKYDEIYCIITVECTVDIDAIALPIEQIYKTFETIAENIASKINNILSNFIK